jgi:hypothetical protein
VQEGKGCLVISATGGGRGGMLLSLTSCHRCRGAVRQSMHLAPFNRQRPWMAVSEEARWDDTTWHPGLLYKLSELKLSASRIKLIKLFLSDRKFRFRLNVKCLRFGKYKQEYHRAPSCPLPCTIYV